MSDILELIKKRTTIRKYQKKKIPKKILDKIIEAGIWGPSVHHFQPWRFVVITNKQIINSIAAVSLKKAETLYAGYNIVMRLSSGTMKDAPLLIAVYNTKEMEQKMNKLGREYKRCAIFSQLEGIAACIQNMILTAETLGIGSNWRVLPIFCEREINSILKIGDELIALITFGYPDEKGQGRLPRKLKSEVVKYLL